MSFFEKLINAASKNRIKHVIDMRTTETLTIEVLLYLISLTNIWRKKKYKFKIDLMAPTKNEIQLLLATSGLGKYFRGNGSGHVGEENIYPMCDGGHDTIDPEQNVNQNDRCIEISDFTRKMLVSNSTVSIERSALNKKLFKLSNIIAEMMRNTDDHAYDDEADAFTPLRNWYFFAGKVQDGVSFYFLDNGKGIIKTAKQKLRDISVYMGASSIEHKIMEEVLSGEFRSRTKLPNRNKGLPEIKDFFVSDDILISTIITNNLVYNNIDGHESFEVKKIPFRGTLYIWIVK